MYQRPDMITPGVDPQGQPLDPRQIQRHFESVHRCGFQQFAGEFPASAPTIKKYQQRFRKVKEEMENWNELQSRLISQFTIASSIIQRLQILQDSKNYGALQCVEGIHEAVLLKQMNSLQTILLWMNETLEKFHSVVLSLEKMVRDGRQLIKGGSVQITVKQLQQRVGIKPRIAGCLDGLNLLSEMHRSEYHLKLSVISAISAVALKPSATDDLGALQQLLVDQPNIPKEEVQSIFDIIFAEEMA